MKLCSVVSTLVSLFFFLLLATTAPYVTADDDDTNMGMPGGYQQVTTENFDDQMQTAAALAARELRVGAHQYSFVPQLPTPLQPGDVRIVRAFQQVVAGLNYRFILAIMPSANEDEQECLGAFAVTIYNRFGEMSITQWGQEIDCTRAVAALRNNQDFVNPMAPEFHG